MRGLQCADWRMGHASSRLLLLLLSCLLLLLIARPTGGLSHGGGRPHQRTADPRLLQATAGDESPAVSTWQGQVTVSIDMFESGVEKVVHLDLDGGGWLLLKFPPSEDPSQLLATGMVIQATGPVTLSADSSSGGVSGGSSRRRRRLLSGGVPVGSTLEVLTWKRVTKQRATTTAGSESGADAAKTTAGSASQQNAGGQVVLGPVERGTVVGTVEELGSGGAADEDTVSSGVLVQSLRARTAAGAAKASATASGKATAASAGTLGAFSTADAAEETAAADNGAAAAGPTATATEQAAQATVTSTTSTASTTSASGSSNTTITTTTTTSSNATSQATANAAFAPTPSIDVLESFTDPSSMASLTAMTAISGIPRDVSSITVLVNNCNGPYAVDPGDLYKVWFNKSATSLSGWFRVCSYGLSIFEPGEKNFITQSVTVCIDLLAHCVGEDTYRQVSDIVMNELNMRGFNTSVFDHILLIMPPYPQVDISCGIPIGRGELGGKLTWIRSDYWNRLEVVAHEMQHNRNLHHASDPRQPTTYVEYGDKSCIMGFAKAGIKCPNAPHLWQLGWGLPAVDLDAGRQMLPGQVNTYTLPPAILNRANFLRITTPRNSVVLYVNHRRSLPPHENMLPEHEGKVLVYRFDESRDEPRWTQILQVLAPGEPFQGHGVTITALAVSAITATVTVCRPLNGMCGGVPPPPPPSILPSATQPPTFLDIPRAASSLPPPVPILTSPRPSPTAASPPTVAPSISRRYGMVSKVAAATLSLRCGPNAFITQVFGTFAYWITTIGATCSDGFQPRPFVASTASAGLPATFGWVCLNGFDAARVADAPTYAPSQLQLRCSSNQMFMMPAAGQFVYPEVPLPFVCPAGQRLVGILGLNNSAIVEQFQFVCGSISASQLVQPQTPATPLPSPSSVPRTGSSPINRLPTTTASPGKPPPALSTPQLQTQGLVAPPKAFGPTPITSPNPTNSSTPRPSSNSTTTSRSIDPPPSPSILPKGPSIVVNTTPKPQNSPTASPVTAKLPLHLPPAPPPSPVVLPSSFPTQPQPSFRQLPPPADSQATPNTVQYDSASSPPYEASGPTPLFAPQTNIQVEVCEDRVETCRVDAATGKCQRSLTTSVICQASCGYCGGLPSYTCFGDGINIPGTQLLAQPASPLNCRVLCSMRPDCAGYTMMSDGTCVMKGRAWSVEEGGAGLAGPGYGPVAGVALTCLKFDFRTGNFMCLPIGYAIAGTQLASLPYDGADMPCLNACLRNSQCEFIMTSTKRGTCQLMTDMFAGTEGANKPGSDWVDRSCIKTLRFMGTSAVSGMVMVP